jgi:hypothetical protein
MTELPPAFIASGAPFLSDSKLLAPGQRGRDQAGVWYLNPRQIVLGVTSLALVGLSIFQAQHSLY